MSDNFSRELRKPTAVASDIPRWPPVAVPVLQHTRIQKIEFAENQSCFSELFEYVPWPVFRSSALMLASMSTLGARTMILNLIGPMKP
jgi:hypothetical protein